MATPPAPDRDRAEAASGRSDSGLARLRARVGTAGFSRGADGLLAGVLAGLAHRFGVSPWLLRVAFLVSMLLPGPQFLLYVGLWIVMPRER